jgi:hypothetical protein
MGGLYKKRGSPKAGLFVERRAGFGARYTHCQYTTQAAGVSMRDPLYLGGQL